MKMKKKVVNLGAWLIMALGDVILHFVVEKKTIYYFYVYEITEREVFEILEHLL